MFDESDIPAGYHDADIEMRELEAAGDRLASLERANESHTAAALEPVEVDEVGQVSIGVPGEQMSLTGLARSFDSKTEEA